MNKKQLRQERALARLTARIAEHLGNGVSPTLAERQQYNRLKEQLGYPGRI